MGNYGLDLLMAKSELFLANPSLKQLAALRLISYYHFYSDISLDEDLEESNRIYIATDCDIMKVFGCKLCPFKNNTVTCELLAALAKYKPVRAGKKQTKRRQKLEMDLLSILIICFAQLQGLIDCYMEGENE